MRRGRWLSLLVLLALALVPLPAASASARHQVDRIDLPAGWQPEGITGKPRSTGVRPSSRREMGRRRTRRRVRAQKASNGAVIGVVRLRGHGHEPARVGAVRTLPRSGDYVQQVGFNAKSDGGWAGPAPTPARAACRPPGRGGSRSQRKSRGPQCGQGLEPDRRKSVCARRVCSPLEALLGSPLPPTERQVDRLNW